MERNESGLAQRLRDRDPQAMAELYDRYGRLVYAVIRRQVNDHSTAEDLVQETFLRVWTRIQGFDGNRGGLGPWVLAVARNRAIDYLRSIECRFSQTTSEMEPGGRPCAVTPGFENDLLDRERIRAIRQAIARLRPDHRLVVQLAFGEGLSHTEIAERLRQPLGTVKTWVRSALKVLRTQVA